MKINELRKRWKTVWQPYDRGASSGLVFEALVAAYGAPDRHYHTLAHVTDCLRTLDTCRADAADPEAIEIALWFHDAVYETHAADNEEQSAAWAVREIGAGERAETVQSLILATRHGAEVPVSGDARLIADIDLAILGADPVTFWAYEEAIRREYEWVPPEIFRRKRAEILRRFLEQADIYQTPCFQNKYDRPARENLRDSVDRLSADGTH